jgi:aminoglycoside 6'-N-acetyltransferase
MADITFRALTMRDMALITAWAQNPHWVEYWGEPAQSIAEIEAAMSDDSTEPMLALLDNKPVAYVQTYDPHLEDGHPYQDQPFGTLGIDISMGDEAMLGQGHGTAILKALIDILFDEGAPRLIIDPDPSNLHAIKVYENAGFAAFDSRVSEYGPALMMAIDNPEFADE